MGSLLLSADALVISANGGTALITAIARDTAGQPVAGAKVHFQGPAGALSPANATTGVDGVAKSTFTASSAPGQAIITAETGGLTQQTRLQMNSLQQDETANTLHLELDAVELDPGQQMPITATLLNGSGQPISGTLVTLFGSLGAVSPASALSDENGRVAATFSAGNVPGEARVSILAGYASISAVLQVIEATTGDHFIYLPLITKGPFILQHGSQLDNGLSG